MRNIAVLVTCHNRKAKTLSCFSTLFAALDKYNGCRDASEQIRIVTYLTDDGCTDGTADAVRQLIDYQEYNVIQGDGNLFWNGGMRAAWNEALKRHEEWDFYLLINDDTDIMENAFEELLKTHDYCIEKYGRDGMYSGITCSKTDDTVSYGGTVFTNRFLAKTKQLGPTGEPQMCDLTNANILLVSKDVVDEIGIFWEGYKHGIADSDYAMKARKHGIPVLLTSCFVGRCNYDHDHDKEESAKVMAMSLSERRKYFSKPTRSNRDYVKFVWRHETLRLPMVLFGRFMNVYFPKLYYSMKNKANAD